MSLIPTVNICVSYWIINQCYTLSLANCPTKFPTAPAAADTAMISFSLGSHLFNEI
jgi:hypothetical protein